LFSIQPYTHQNLNTQSDRVSDLTFMWLIFYNALVATLNARGITCIVQ